MSENFKSVCCNSSFYREFDGITIRNFCDKCDKSCKIRVLFPVPPAEVERIGWKRREQLGLPVYA